MSGRRRLARLVRLPVGLMLAAAGVIIVPASQTPSAVDVYAAVEAANGIPIDSLTADDFEIASDGAPVPFTLTSGPQPLDTLLLADLTSSVTGRVRSVPALPWPEAFSFAADRLILDVRPTDRARIVGMIGPRLVASPTWSSDRQTLQRGVRVFALPDAPVEPSPLWDALDEALTMFPPEPRRRAVVLVTDGRASANRTSLAEVSERAMIAGIAVSVVELDPPPRSLALPHSEKLPGPGALIVRLTSASGGVRRFVTPDARGTHETRAAVGQILDVMRTSYRLTFTPPAAGPPVRALDVRVKRPGLTVRARQGYRWGGGECCRGTILER